MDHVAFEDALDLQYRSRALLHAVSRNYDFLRFCTGKVGAAVWHKAVIGILKRHVGIGLRQYRVIAHLSRDGKVRRRAQERIIFIKVVDAVRNIS